MLTPHNLGQKGSVGEVHDNRPDSAHEAELRKAGEEKNQAHESDQTGEPHED